MSHTRDHHEQALETNPRIDDAKELLSFCCERSPRRRFVRAIGCYLVLCWIVVVSTACTSAAIEPDFLMEVDPAFPAPEPIKKFNPALKKLWLEALNRPETDMKRLAAETIARATKFGVPGLDEAIPVLERILQDDASDPTVRFAVARALIELNSRNSADNLLDASNRYGSDLRQLVEPVLAEWDVASVRSVWIGRLDHKPVQQRDLFLALRGLGRVRETSVLPTALKMTGDLIQSPDVRLEAALVAGQIASSGLEKDAERLSHEKKSSLVVNRLCAVQLLSRHDSDEAQKILLELASDSEPSIAVAALSRLNEIDPSLVLPLAEAAIKSDDQRVREQGALSYLMRPTVERIETLSSVLNDPHPAVRHGITNGLLKLAARPEFDEVIRRTSTDILAGDKWQGQEQAALLLASLDHKAAANRLVELLKSPRPEVMVSTAWGLRKLAVPSTIPAMIQSAMTLTMERKLNPRPGVDHQVAHLFEAFGVMRASESIPLMMQYVPYGPRTSERSRCAAVWALGVIHEGKNHSLLADKFIFCIEDGNSRPPESDLVKQMCVVALVRMKSVEQTSAIRDDLKTFIRSTPLGLAIRWAMKELLDVDLPEPPPVIADQGSWFLEPAP